MSFFVVALILSGLFNSEVTMEENNLEKTVHRREQLKKYFSFTTYRITLLSVMIALNIVMAVFSKFVMGLIPIFDFLVVEVTFFVYLIVAFSINTFYSAIMIVICTWIRLPILDDEWVGLIAMTLSDEFQLIFIMIFVFLFMKIIKIDDFQKKVFVVYIISILLAILLNSALNDAWNYWLTLPLYKKMYGLDLSSVMSEYLAVVFGFNILKYSINCIIFLMLLKILIHITNRHKW
jgi:riboflavin transporter FmnP